MLCELKRLLGIDEYDTTKDRRIESVLQLAQEEALNFCNIDPGEEIPSSLKNAVMQMAIIKYNRLGTEGLINESYAGASYNYVDKYPESIMTALRRNRRLRAI